MTFTVKDKTDLVVPPSVRRRAGIKIGDRLEFRVTRGVMQSIFGPAARRIEPEGTTEWSSPRRCAKNGLD